MKVLVVVACLLAQLPASAIPISSSVGRFDVSTVECLSVDVACRRILKSQVWWGDRALAHEFTRLVRDDLGRANGGHGPLFALMEMTGSGSMLSMAWDGSDVSGSNRLGRGLRTWAVATRTAVVPEPSTLGLVGIGLIALLLARRRKAGVRSLARRG